MNDEEIEQAQDLAWASDNADFRMVARGYPVADVMDDTQEAAK